MREDLGPPGCKPRRCKMWEKARGQTPCSTMLRPNRQIQDLMNGIKTPLLTVVVGLWASVAVLAAESDLILDWNALMLNAIRQDDSGPTLGSRNLAILHTAIYDSINSIQRTHQPYRFLLDAPAGTSPQAAALAAGHEVILSLYPAMKSRADALYEESVAGLPSGPAFTNGLGLGQTVARQMLDWRSADGA